MVREENQSAGSSPIRASVNVSGRTSSRDTSGLFREKSAVFQLSSGRAALLQDRSVHELQGLALTCFPVAAAFGQTRTFLLRICIRSRSPRLLIHLFQAPNTPRIHPAAAGRARLGRRGRARYIKCAMLNYTAKTNVAEHNSSGLTALLISPGWG